MTHRIITVDSGTGGTVVSNRLAEELESEMNDGDVGITLVSNDTKHVYKSAFLYVPFGVAKPDDGIRDLRDLVDERVDIVINHVRRVDTDERCLYCQDGDEELDYNALVLVVGAKLDPNAIPGFREGTRRFCNADGAERFRDTLAEFEGGHFVLSVVGTPHMCSTAPLEFTFIMDDWLRSCGLREDMDPVYTYPMERNHGKPEVTEWTNPILVARSVRVETDFVVDAVDPDERVVSVESDAEMDYGLLIGIPPHRGDELIADSGPGDAGWVDVDQRTLRVTTAEDVYAIGDTATLPIPRAGSVAYFQAFTVVERIATEIRGRTPTKCYDGRTVYFVETGLGEASFISFDYETPATMRQPSKPVHWVKHTYNESYWLTVRGML